MPTDAEEAIQYRLNELAELAAELGLVSYRVDANQLDVMLDDAVLSFRNTPEQEDTLLGFLGGDWHAHGFPHFQTGPSTYAEYDELDVLIGLSEGNLLIVSSVFDGVVRDRRIVHHAEPFDLRGMVPGEETRIRRLRIGAAPSQ